MFGAPSIKFVVQASDQLVDGKPVELKAWAQIVPAVGAVVELFDGKARSVTAVHYRLLPGEASGGPDYKAEIVVTISPIQATKSSS